MMQMHFGRKLRNRYTEVTGFTGADFSTKEEKVSLSASPDMANVYVDVDGTVKKRTGVKKLLAAAGNVNGMFSYEYRDDTVAKTQYFAHIGTDLYFFSIEDDAIVLGDCICTDLADKKSRSFTFGGALYILGAGYFKIMWDSVYRTFVCGRVCRAETQTQRNTVLLSECKADTAVSHGTPAAWVDADCLYKEVWFELGWYTFDGTMKLYVAPPELVGKVRVAELYVGNETRTGTLVDPYHYKVESDAKGLYVMPDRVNIYIGERFYCRPKVLLTYNSFVYTPTNITGRTPTGITAVDGELEEDASPLYDGTLVEAYNIASVRRAVEFYCTPAAVSAGRALRLYLEPEKSKGEIAQISIDGAVIHRYVVYRDSQDVYLVSYTDCEYVDISKSLLPDSECVIRVEYTKYASRQFKETDYLTDACTVFGLYGGKNDTRVFLTGNPIRPGRDYASHLYDATYFPDSAYTDVGADQSEIIGYHKISGYQVIIKDGRHFDAAQYLRAYTTDSDARAVFTIQQGAHSVGACCISSFKTCGDHMLFAAQDGVYEVKSTQVAAQTNIQCLSEAVNGRLRKENLRDAVCVVWQGKYYLAVGTSMYILDTERGMQWYYYKDLPSVCSLWVQADTLLIGSSDGCIYRFMAETEKNAYYDNVSVDGSLAEAHAICGYWKIPVTCLGSGYRRKSVEDLCIYLMPQRRTSLCVSYYTDLEYARTRHTEDAERFAFDLVDFASFTFEACEYPVCINTRAKAKRVHAFGAMLENSVAGEPMTITGFAIKYRENNAIK